MQAGLLAPDGQIMATYSGRATPDGGCAHDYGATVRLILTDGTFTDLQVPGVPIGWIDDRHMLVQEDLPAFASPGAVAPIKIVERKSSAVIEVDGAGFFAGALPGGFD